MRTRRRRRRRRKFIQGLTPWTGRTPSAKEEEEKGFWTCFPLEIRDRATIPAVQVRGKCSCGGRRRV
jgi:hypothetical protein